jgi:DNA-binding MarR family transcriptional regulator
MATNVLRRRTICKPLYDGPVPDRHLYLDTATTSQYVAQIADRQLSPLGVPPTLVALLTHVRDLEPVPPSELSRAAGSPATTLRDNVQRLVDRRLVRRVPNRLDGRSYLLRITPRGRRALEAADPALLEAYLALERHLPRPREEYERILAELNAALENALGDLLGVEARSAGAA